MKGFLLYYTIFAGITLAIYADETLDLIQVIRHTIDKYGIISAGPTYTRWGQTKCEAGSELVYDGYAAGKKYNSEGSGANYLCLTKTPEWGTLKNYGKARSSIYGVETDVVVFTPSITDKDMSCAVCQLKYRSSVVMIPGRKSCPSGWTVEYWGYLMSEISAYRRTSSEYVCVDNEPVGVPGGDKNNDNAVWYLVGGRCGSLKCPPYVDGKELTCVVCSR